MAKTDTPQPANEPTTDTSEPAPKAKVATPALEAAAAGMTTADVIAAHEANMPAPADPVQSFLASLELRIAELEQIVADVVRAAHEANMPAPADPVQSFLPSLELRIAELEQIVADVVRAAREAQPVLAEIKPLAGFFAKLFSHFGHKL